MNFIQPFFGVSNIGNDICDGVVEYWLRSNEKIPGAVGSTTGHTVNTDHKDSVDVLVNTHTERDFGIQVYLNSLTGCLNEYFKKYPYSNRFSPLGILEDLSIQYYPPGGGFKVWHSERCSGRFPISTRNLVFMTYLNDIQEDNEFAGGTEWVHQEIKLKAKKGDTVIWPADWTFTHRGIVASNSEKYIITGWVNYMDGLNNG